MVAKQTPLKNMRLYLEVKMLLLRKNYTEKKRKETYNNYKFGDYTNHFKSNHICKSFPKNRKLIGEF